jgi:hypothetical protein
MDFFERIPLRLRSPTIRRDAGREGRRRRVAAIGGLFGIGGFDDPATVAITSIIHRSVKGFGDFRL